MIDYDLITLAIAVAVLISSLVSLGLIIALYRLALPKVEVHAGISGQNPSPPGVDDGEMWLELTAVNQRPRQVTILGFCAIMRNRKPLELPTFIRGSEELAELSSVLPCKIEETDMATQMQLLRVGVIDESDSKQVEYFFALDGHGQSWRSRRWPLKQLLGWPENYVRRGLEDTSAPVTPPDPEI